MLRKLSMFPALGSSGLMKQKSCSALQCNVPCSLIPGALGVSSVCVVCTLMLWLAHFVFSPIICNDSLPAMGRVFPFHSRPVWDGFGLELSQTGCLS